MPGGTLFEFGLIVLLILANGIFAAAELAIVSARRGRLEQRAQEGRGGAAVAMQLAEDPNRFLSTVQVGITLISTLAAAFGGASLARAIEGMLNDIPAIAPYSSGLALALVVALISYLSLILGELVPKRLALQNAEGIASVLAPVMRLLSRIGGPLVSLLTVSANAVLWILRRHDVEETPVNEEDVVALVREGVEEGTLHATEHELIANVFNFTERSVRAVMTPRTQMVALELGEPMEEVLRTIQESGFSRIPVYRENLDRIAGVLYAKDLLRAWGASGPADLEPLLRAPLYVVESQTALAAFQLLKQRKASMAIVVDEYGQVSGLISAGDLVEEVVGTIPDEYSTGDQRFARRDDGSFLVDGLLPVDELARRIDIPTLEELARERNFETVAGLILTLLGRVPEEGEMITWRGYVFEVLDMDLRRIDKVIIRHMARESGQQNEGALAMGAVLPLPPREQRRGDGERLAGD